MKILFVTHFLPYPPTDGGRIGYYNPLKYLSRKHELVLVSIAGPADESNIRVLRSFCCDVLTLSDQHPHPLRLLRGLVGSPPGTASKYLSERFGNLVAAAIRKHTPDIVELQHLNTAAYLPYCNGIPTILREHNVEYKVWERFAETAASYPRRFTLRAVAARVRRYEGTMAPKFARCITVSDADERYLRQVAPTARIVTIPSGVDCEYFTPAPVDSEIPNTMILTGSFAWKPKQHNLRVLVSEIYPRIRSKVEKARLIIVGKGVPANLRRLAESHGAEVVGSVPDVRPFLRSAALVLNYVEAGGGIALKVLEAMATRKPVLSNSLGCEGISVRNGDHIILADGPTGFADAAVELLSNKGRRSALAEQGYRLVQERYGSHSLVGHFEHCYQQVLDERGVPDQIVSPPNKPTFPF